MTVTVRFAPSPTGFIHIGNLRTALFNWLLASQQGGRFYLRFDDTDRARSRTEFADAIEEDLSWLGLTTDRIVRQSERLALYDAAADRLRSAGLLYPCYETPDELDRQRKRLAMRNRPPIYGREALRLSDKDREALMAEGRRPYWRFLLPNFEDDPFHPVRTESTWKDLVRGNQTVDLASLSDPVLIRDDGSYLYTFTSVVDDAELDITHIVRGEDHITNTGVQIALFRSLGYEEPAFGHHNLITTVDGEGLSKRSGALSIKALREEGLEPLAVASLAVLVGLPGSIEPAGSLQALADRLDLSAVSASASKFDPSELYRLNAEIVHSMPYEAAAERLAAFGVPYDQAETFWVSIRSNCSRVADASEWAAIVFGTISPATSIESDDRAYLNQALKELPEGRFDHSTWKVWTDRLKAASGRRGRSLFMPLRLALTGLDNGPDMSTLLPLIDRDRCAIRLQRLIRISEAAAAQ